MTITINLIQTLCLHDIAIKEVDILEQLENKLGFVNCLTL